MTLPALPCNFLLRPYQFPVWEFFANGGLRAVSVWHRRAGKDLTALHRTAVEAFKRVGTYWHMLPEAAQGRKVIWDAIVENQSGKAVKLLEWVFPLEIRKKTYSQEMKIEFLNGSIWQLCGSDNYNSLIGSNPVGVVMSEFSIAKPSAWTYIRPILTENNGWAWFLFTPRGMNHGWDLWRMSQDNPDWFSEILTVDETVAIAGNLIQGERNAGMAEEMIQQEFYCSFEAAIVGSYYAKAIIDAEKAGRVTNVPYDPSCQVHTSWDIGVDDCTSIWFWQALPGGELHCIDYLEHSGEGVTYYLNELQKRPYAYGTDYVPHDFEARSFAAGGKSAADTARQHGRRLSVIPSMSPLDRIEASRAIIPRTWFDKTKTEEGRASLKNYRREWNEDRKTFMSTPVHDWSSHGSDAFGHFAVGYKAPTSVRLPTSKRPIGRPGIATSGWMER